MQNDRTCRDAADNQTEPERDQLTALEDQIRELKQTNAELLAQLDLSRSSEKYVQEWSYALAKAYYDSQAGICMIRLSDNIVVDVNQRAAELLDYRREEMIGRNAADFWAIPPARDKELEAISKTGRLDNVEVAFRKKSGEAAIGLVSATIFDFAGHPHLVTSGIDITRHKKAEAALQLSEEKFSRAFYSNQNPMYISDIDTGVFMDVNDAVTDLLGYSREELIGSSSLDLNIWVDPLNRHKRSQKLREVGFIKKEESLYRCKDGSVHTCLTSNALLEIKGKTCILGSMIDITDLKQTEESLLRYKQNFIRAFNLTPESMIMVSLKEGIVRAVNVAYLEHLDVIREDLIGRRFKDSGIWKDSDDAVRYTRLVQENREVRNFETNYVDQAGETRTVLLSGIVLPWEGEECIFTISVDITEMRRFENEMARLDRFYIIGEMATGIAHEVRNPMTTVRGFLQLFKGRDSFQDEMENMVLMIEELDRANAILTQFLSLAKNKRVELEPANLSDKLRAVAPLLKAMANRQDMNLELDLRRVPYLMLDQSETRQLIMNLVRNGLEAMDRGGTLTIRTFADPVNVTLAVQDQGSGIAPENADKIGTPFFTTKNSGTGMGLAVCYSIAERHHARLSFETGPEGTTFYISFPIYPGRIP